MKNIFTFMILLITQISWAQTDSMINSKSIDCLVYRKCMKKNPIFKNIELVDDSIEIKKVKSIVFLGADSLHLMKGTNKVFALNLKDLKEVNIKSGTLWFTGLILGSLAGGLLSGVVASGMHDFKEGNFTTIGVISGTVLGGIIGALIGSSFDDYETLNLRNDPLVVKKAKLLEFIRHKD